MEWKKVYNYKFKKNSWKSSNTNKAGNIMASYFIYDSINQYRSDNTISEGQMTDSSTPTFSASDTLGSH